MIEWLATLLPPIVGAGAAPMFAKLFGRKSRMLKPKEPPPGSLGDVNKRLDEIDDWQENVEDLIARHEKEILRLRKSLRWNRLLFVLDVILVVLLGGLWAWYHFFLGK